MFEPTADRPDLVRFPVLLLGRNHPMATPAEVKAMVLRKFLRVVIELDSIFMDE